MPEQNESSESGSPTLLFGAENELSSRPLQQLMGGIFARGGLYPEQQQERGVIGSKKTRNDLAGDE